MSNRDILREFLLETHENLALLDADLIRLESNPHDKSTLAQAFRTLHSVKGTAGFMGLPKLQSVAHSAEHLLSRMRSGELDFNQPIATALLRVGDAVREMLACIESDGTEGKGEYNSLIAELDCLRESSSAPAAPLALSEAIAPPQVKVPPSRESSEESEEFEHQCEGTASRTPSPAHVPAESLAPSAGHLSGTGFEVAGTSPPEPYGQPWPESVESPGVGGIPENRPAGVSESSIRVDVDLLDTLMTLVGELVLARNQILQFSELSVDGGYLDVVQRLNLLTSELQASVMKTRMQPIGNILGKFPRIVRDLALACGKKVRFESHGEETELDKTLLEAIRDPLTHMVRNAVDHGIELPEARVSLGKPEEGRLRMTARHEGGKVIVEVSDDGEGIDVARVREKALNQRLISAEAATRMSQFELLRLVFLPGFSTSDSVTQFSGRGVGMDVVRTNLEKIGGSVEIESKRGQGTTVRAKIPLTLAIIPALVVSIGDDRFAIPQSSILELVRIDAESESGAIERLYGAPVYRLRGKLLPLIFLDRELRLKSVGDEGRDRFIVVLQANHRHFGVVVDAVRDTEEIVVKPLQKQLASVSLFAGATIMGDGSVALVVDVLGLAQRAGLDLASGQESISDAAQETQDAASDSEQMLLFVSRAGGQMAVPLSRVDRLEEVSSSQFEKLGTADVIQYRGAILQLIDVSRELTASQESQPLAPDSKFGSCDPEQDAPIPIIVCHNGTERAGLLVGRILDIFEEQPQPRTGSRRRGVLYSSIVQGTVTEVLDVPHLLDVLGARGV